VDVVLLLSLEQVAVGAVEVFGVLNVGLSAHDVVQVESCADAGAHELRDDHFGVVEAHVGFDQLVVAQVAAERLVLLGQLLGQFHAFGLFAGGLQTVLAAVLGVRLVQELVGVVVVAFVGQVVETLTFSVQSGVRLAGDLEVGVDRLLQLDEGLLLGGGLGDSCDVDVVFHFHAFGPGERLEGGRDVAGLVDINVALLQHAAANGGGHTVRVFGLGQGHFGGMHGARP